MPFHYDSVECITAIKALARQRIKHYAYIISNVVMYLKLSLYNQSVTTIQMWPWWRVAERLPSLARKCMLLIKIMFRETGLHADTYMFNSGKDSLCKLCDMYCSETANHVFFQCAAYCDR